MPLEVVTVPYGRSADDELADRVLAAKAGGPLAPVTVVVPSNYVGVAARRRLGREAGVLGVSFLTVYRLAELLGAATLAGRGRRPISNPVLLAAVQEELRVEAGVFEPVRTHPATEEALVLAHKQLADLSPAALDQLAEASAQSGAVVDLHRRVKARLSAWFDEADLLDAAADQVERGHPVAAELGQVVVHLPQDLSRRSSRLVGAIAGAGPVLVLAALTGEDDADAAVRRALRWIGWTGELPAPASPPVRELRVVTTSDSDEEVRAAVRVVVDAARAGMPFERMAIVHPADDRFGGVVHHQLATAGVPLNGTTPVRLADRVTGRTALGLLRLAREAPRRDDIFTLLASAPIRGADGRLVPTVAWERRSREAGVVGIDRQEWEQRLFELAASLERDALTADADDREALAGRRRQEASDAVALRDFVLGLIDRLDELAAGSSWAELAARTGALIDDLLGSERHRQAWPDEERDAAELVDAVLERLGHLDPVSPKPDVARFERALQLELDVDVGRRGRLGEGVLVGGLGVALGLDLDLVVVLGMAEGVLPTRPRDDPLLPDRDRRRVADELPVAAERQGREHRQLLAAVAAAGTVVLTMPRGDLRRTTEHVASRWLLELVHRHHGVRLWSDELRDLHAPWLHHVPSFAGGLHELVWPATEQEAMLAWELNGRRLLGDPALARAVRTVAAHAATGLTPYDGFVTGVAIPSPTAPTQIVSPTRLEAWVGCPYAYFLRYLLRVEPVENPEEILRISPLDSGTLIHRALERYVAERIRLGDTADPPDLDLLRRFFELACQEAEARGVTGRPVLWQHDRADLWKHLVEFVEADSKRAAAASAVPVAAELGFGDSGHEVVATIGRGRSLRFRGSIDRVDRAADDHLLVTDYKYASTRKYKDVGPDNPTANGSVLQLPIYALAAQDAFNRGRLPLPVTARYAFVKPDNKGRLPEPISLSIDSEVLDHWAAVLDVIVDGIERGLFVARPPDVDRRIVSFNPCPSCDPDGLGVADARRRWERKRQAPELARYTALLGIEAIDEEHADA